MPLLQKRTIRILPPTAIELTEDEIPSEYDRITFKNDFIVNICNKMYEKNALAYKGSNPLNSSIKYMGLDDTDIWTGAQHWYEITNKFGIIKYPSGAKPLAEQLKDGTRSAAAPLLSPELEAYIASFCKGNRDDHLIKYYMIDYYINSALKVHVEQNKGNISAENNAQYQKQLNKNLTKTKQELQKFGININSQTGELKKSTQQNTSTPPLNKPYADKENN